MPERNTDELNILYVCVALEASTDWSELGIRLTSSYCKEEIVQ